MARLLVLSVLAFGAVTTLARAEDKFSSKEGKYTIQFPGQPKESAQEVDTPAGKLKMFITLVEVNKDNGFLVIHNDYAVHPAKEKAQTVLVAVRDGNKGPTGKVIEDKEITYGTNMIPGRAFLLEKGGVYIRARVYLHGKRLYQILVAGKKKEDVTSKGADKFLDSFEITD